MAKTKDSILRAVKKYNKSPKGRIARKKYVERNREKVRDYNIQYQKEYKKQLKKNKQCTRCLQHNDQYKDYITCKKCRAYQIKKYWERKRG